MEASRSTINFGSRESVEGAASGALFMALFGVVWATAGAITLGGVTETALLYGVEKYYVTGSFLCSLALIVVLVAPQQYWLTLVGLGSGGALFATAVHSLFRGTNQLRSGVRA